MPQNNLEKGMKNLLILVGFLSSMNLVAGTKFYEEKDKMFSDGTKGFELVYDQDKDECIKEWWDGDSSETVEKKVRKSKCNGFKEALERVAESGACVEGKKLLDIKTILGLTAREELILDRDCVCYKYVTVDSAYNDNKKFTDFSDCEEAFSGN